jgi:putative Holliday junction resolvase
MTAQIIAVEEIPQAAPGPGSLLGLDLGTKTIGVAVCDPAGSIATPITTIRRTKFTADATALAELAVRWKARAYVLGLPTNMDGSEGPRAQATRAFARNFARIQGLPIALWDERLSTAAVERMLIAQDMSRARRAEVVDQHAAAFILQGAIDRLRILAGTDRAARGPEAT